MKSMLRFVFTISIMTAFQCYGQIELKSINGIWIATSSESIGFNWITSNDGQILRLQNGQGELLNVRHNDVEHFKYTITDDQLIVDDSISVGLIEELSGDKMTMRIGPYKRSEFRRLTPFDFQLEEEFQAMLISNPWYMTLSEGDVRIDFSESPWDRYKLFKSCLAHYSYEDYVEREEEKWRIVHYKNIYIFAISYDQLDMNVYQITSTKDGEIEMIDLNSVDQAKSSLKAIPPITKARKELLVNMMASHEWTMDKAKSEEESYGYSRDAENFIPKEIFFLNNLTFQFSPDGQFAIKSKDRTLKSGKWYLSPDGSYLIFDRISNFPGTNYFELLSIEPDKLLLSHRVELRTEENKYKVYRCITTLKEKR